MTLKAPNKNCSRRHLFFFLLSFEEIRLDVSNESSAYQKIHLRYHVLFSLKNNEKIFMNVGCCSLIGALRDNDTYGLHEILPSDLFIVLMPDIAVELVYLFSPSLINQYCNQISQSIFLNLGLVYIFIVYYYYYYQ